MRRAYAFWAQLDIKKQAIRLLVEGNKMIETHILLTFPGTKEAKYPILLSEAINYRLNTYQIQRKNNP